MVLESKNQRRDRRRREYEEEQEEQQRLAEIERARRASLTMYERIEEFVTDDELKVILHKLAEQCGLEN